MIKEKVQNEKEMENDKEKRKRVRNPFSVAES